MTAQGVPSQLRPGLPSIEREIDARIFRMATSIEMAFANLSRAL